jgi:hypothetical protein
MVEIDVGRTAVVGIAAVDVVGIVVDIMADQMSLEFLHMLIESCPMAIATPDASSAGRPCISCWGGGVRHFKFQDSTIEWNCNCN